MHSLLESELKRITGSNSAIILFNMNPLYLGTGVIERPGGTCMRNEEVEIEQRSDAIIIKPKTKRASQLRAQILRKMKAAGLIEDLSWEQPPVVSPKERARLAKQLSHGQPLSEIIIEDREQPA